VDVRKEATKKTPRSHHDAITESSAISAASVEPKKLISKPHQKSAVTASTSEASKEKQA